MYKLFFVLLLSAGLCVHAHAQANGIALGLKVGLNYSNVYDSEGEDFIADPIAGFAGGAFVMFPIGRHFGVQPELLISQKGFKSTGRLLGSTYSMTRTTTYVDVPLLLNIRPASFINILVGPQYSYLTKEKNVFDNGTTTILQEQEFKNTDIRKNTLCFTGGLDVTVKRIVVSARVGWDFQRNRGDGTNETPRYKNTWVQATLGYKIW